MLLPEPVTVAPGQSPAVPGNPSSRPQAAPHPQRVYRVGLAAADDKHRTERKAPGQTMSTVLAPQASVGLVVSSAT